MVLCLPRRDSSDDDCEGGGGPDDECLKWPEELLLNAQNLSALIDLLFTALVRKKLDLHCDL